MDRRRRVRPPPPFPLATDLQLTMFALCYLKSLSSRIRISTNHLSESIRENSGTVICIVCMVRGGSEGYGTVREGTGNCLPCWRILRNPASHSLWLEIRLVRISIQIILIRYVLIRLVRNVARMIRNRFVSSVSPSMKLAKSSTSSSLQQSAIVAQLFSFIQPFLPFFFLFAIVFWLVLLSFFLSSN